jgi:hypothetical protein
LDALRFAVLRISVQALAVRRQQAQQLELLRQALRERLALLPLEALVLRDARAAEQRPAAAC